MKVSRLDLVLKAEAVTINPTFSVRILCAHRDPWAPGRDESLRRLDMITKLEFTWMRLQIELATHVRHIMRRDQKFQK